MVHFSHDFSSSLGGARRTTSTLCEKTLGKHLANQPIERIGRPKNGLDRTKKPLPISVIKASRLGGIKLTEPTLDCASGGVFHGHKAHLNIMRAATHLQKHWGRRREKRSGQCARASTEGDGQTSESRAQKHTSGDNSLPKSSIAHHNRLGYDGPASTRSR
jgi:hypothetical protein